MLPNGSLARHRSPTAHRSSLITHQSVNAASKRASNMGHPGAPLRKELSSIDDGANTKNASGSPSALTGKR